MAAAYYDSAEVLKAERGWIPLPRMNEVRTGRARAPGRMGACTLLVRWEEEDVLLGRG
jgi:hypothetical protein